MTTQARKARGMRTQLVIARHLNRNGWPFAESAGAGRQGSDILGTPDLAIEVKARTGFQPLAWVKQAEAASDGRLPVVIFRCNGQGEDAARYPAMLRTGDLIRLLHAAGYGDPEAVA